MGLYSFRLRSQFKHEHAEDTENFWKTYEEKIKLIRGQDQELWSHTRTMTHLLDLWVAHSHGLAAE